MCGPWEKCQEYILQMCILFDNLSLVTQKVSGLTILCKVLFNQNKIFLTLDQ